MENNNRIYWTAKNSSGGTWLDELIWIRSEYYRVYNGDYIFRRNYFDALRAQGISFNPENYPYAQDEKLTLFTCFIRFEPCQLKDLYQADPLDLITYLLTNKPDHQKEGKSLDELFEMNKQLKFAYQY